MKEEWRKIEGHKGAYEVSNFGRVRSYKRTGPSAERLKSPKLLKGYVDANGYVSYNFAGRPTKGHRLVANAFIPKVEGKNCVNHIDSDRTNNRVSNLEWCTHSENSKHAHDKGRQKNVFDSGEKHPEAKLSHQEVNEIKDRYACGKINQYELADEYGISQQHVSKIVNNKTWGSYENSLA